MNTGEKLTYLENYLTSYFDEMLIADIEKIMSSNLHFTFPYVLLVSTGIDFLGGLTEGFRDNNSQLRSRRFTEVWMGRINSLYSNQYISEVIYKSVRCGSVHQAMYKKGIESSSRLYPRDKHLHHMTNFKGKDRIFIHALQLADDFIQAQLLYRNEYMPTHADVIYDNLEAALKTDPIPGFDDAISYLKGLGLTFDAQDEARRNPEVKEFDPETERVIFKNDITTTTSFSSPPSIESTVTAMPSAAPDPDA